MTSVDFYGAAWCKACDAKYPLVEQSCKEHGVPLTYHDVDDPDQAEQAGTLGFRSVPAVVVWRGANPVYRAVGGLINRASLDTHLGMSDSPPAAP